VLVRSNNHLPSGQLRFTHRPKLPVGYFTRLAAASIYRCSSLGDGSSPISLSHADIRRNALAGGCRLPDAILHGKRSFRPRSRAVQHLVRLDFE
jgi:hypothetical protein